MENGELPGDIIQAQPAGKQLTQQRRPAGSSHAHLQRQNQYNVQQDVQQAAHNQKHQGRPGVAQGTENTGQQVVQHGRGDAQENDEDVIVGVGEGILRRVHPDENPAAQQRRDQRYRQGNDAAEPDHVSHEPAKAIIILLTEFLGHGNGKARADTVAQSQHQEVDGAGGADACQSVHPQKFAHHNGIHHAVELLEQQSENQGHHERKNQPHRGTGC